MALLAAVHALHPTWAEPAALPPIAASWTEGPDSIPIFSRETTTDGRVRLHGHYPCNFYL